MANTKKKSCANPIVRNDLGLIIGVDYKYTESGLIDWKAMVPLEYLYVNNSADRIGDIEARYGKSASDIDIEKDDVKDSDLVISLSGIKYLLKLRGYDELTYSTFSSNEDYAAVSCSITFKANFETEGLAVKFQDNACAHHNNTFSWYSKYLLEAATNRSMCRCVRNFLGIQIVSKEELGSGTKEPNADKVDDKAMRTEKLRGAMSEVGLTWEQLKQKISKAQVEKGAYKNLNLSKTNGIEDLPNDIIFDITSKLKRAKK